ncbi:MAG: hypothetical protein WEF50_04360 [Myxococcota bacterium]
MTPFSADSGYQLGLRSDTVWHRRRKNAFIALSVIRSPGVRSAGMFLVGQIVEHADFSIIRVESPGSCSRSKTSRAFAALALDDLALWDGDSQLAIGHLVDLDRDTRTMVSDLVAQLGVADHSRIDRWLASTDAIVGNRARRIE